MTTFGKHTPRETHPIGLDGLLELAALDADGQITYCTTITDDVLGLLAPEEITFTFTIHPGATISANHRMHWARKAALTRDLRTRAAYAWMQQGRLRLDRALCVVDVSYPDRRRRDVDNLTPTVKALIDGMVHPAAGVRGLLPDDSDDYLVGPDKRPTGVPTPGVYTLRLHFTELNPPASSERTPS